MKRTKWTRRSKYFLDGPHYFYDNPHLSHILLSVLYIKQNLLTFSMVRKLHKQNRGSERKILLGFCKWRLKKICL